MNISSSAELRASDVDQVDGDAREQLLTIYHLIRVDSVDYDKAQELVVAAAHVEHARQVSADRANAREQGAWLDPRRSTVVALGIAATGLGPRILVFNILGA